MVLRYSDNQKTDDTLTRVLFTTNDTRHIIDHGAITRFPAYSHTNSAIFACIFEPDENDLAATVCPRHRDLFGQGGKRPGGETGSPLLVQCVMRRRTGTSAPSALPVRLMAAKNFLSTNRKSTFLSLFLSHQWRIFKSLYDAIGPKCNTFMSVVMMLE